MTSNLLKNLHKSHYQLLEAKRKKEEATRNDERFDAYNNRRQAAGLPRLNLCDYYNRKHGHTKLQPRINQLEADRALQVTHRDNVVLLNR